MSALMARRYFTRGIAELRSNELDDACQDLQAAVQLVPSFYEARMAYATALLRLKDPPRAIQTLRAGLHYTANGRGRALLCRALGDALVAGGDFLAAEQAFAESQASSPQASADLHDRLARLRARTGRFDEAFTELLAAARLTKTAD
ncbi:MAG TPA: tetratricopeptide repeat protein [Pseudomonadota bacterium]|jgi:predicted Zn-dependent protease|nr:tetratricopeptide repeat protein [Pseudomonadota bacterium]